jgi:hypothetical protein
MQVRKKSMVDDMNAAFAETLHSVPGGNSEFATMHPSERPAFWTLSSGYRSSPTFCIPFFSSWSAQLFPFRMFLRHSLKLLPWFLPCILIASQ